MAERKVAISDEQAQRMMQQQQDQQERQAQADEQREAMMRAFVTAEGRERLSRIAQVKPERARAVEQHIISACRQGKLQPPVGDDIVRELLTQIASDGPGGKAPTITVVRKKTDDDW
jgi:programmed cell death protein 5